jgi:uncharacterized glyoxalase superfamily protein PhnB
MVDNPQATVPQVKGGAVSCLTVDGAVKAAEFYKKAFAADAGCTATMPPADMFWGDRYGQLKDPFGVAWALNGPVRK